MVRLAQRHNSRHSQTHKAAFDVEINSAIPQLVQLLSDGNVTVGNVIVELADNRMFEPVPLFLVVDWPIKRYSKRRSIRQYPSWCNFLWMGISLSAM
jgi:hypothetical protein